MASNTDPNGVTADTSGMMLNNAAQTTGPGAGFAGNTAFTTVDPAGAPGGGTYSNILDQLLGRLPGAPPDYSQFLNQGVNSPLLQSVLGPALANLNKGFGIQDQQLQDQFRQAGALGSGAQGSAFSNLKYGQSGQQGNMIANIISSMLPQMTQGLNQQYQNQLGVPGLLGSTLGTARPQVVQGNISAMNQGTGPGGAGGAGGAGGGGNSLGFGGSGFYAENDPYFQAAQKASYNPFDIYKDPAQQQNDFLTQPMDLGGGFDYAAYEQNFLNNQPAQQAFNPSPVQYNYGNGGGWTPQNADYGAFYENPANYGNMYEQGGGFAEEY